MLNPDILKTLHCFNCLIHIRPCAFSTTPQNVAPSLIFLFLVSDPRLHQGLMAVHGRVRLHLQQLGSKPYYNHDTETPAWMGRQMKVSRKAYMFILTGCVAFILNSSCQITEKRWRECGTNKGWWMGERIKMMLCTLAPTDHFAEIWDLHIRLEPECEKPF